VPVPVSIILISSEQLSEQADYVNAATSNEEYPMNNPKRKYTRKSVGEASSSNSKRTKTSDPDMTAMVANIFQGVVQESAQRKNNASAGMLQVWNVQFRH
jgi:hypothetical protein